MASLTGQTIQSTYDSLLKISGNDPLTASLQRITDGLGNFTPLYLSTTAVEISSGLNVIGSITGSNLSGTNTGDETNSSIKTKLGAASASQDGYLTSTDWSTFNAKQSALGYTPVPQTRTLTINGTTFDLSADRSWTIAAGVTSFNTRTGAITLTSGDVTGALGYTPYNASNPNGYISGITRTQVINALSTGGSPFEFLKSDGSVDTNSYVTFGRTITINGTTFDLSANRSYSVGTVTSVSGTGIVSGLTLTGSVTGSGSLTLGGTLSLTSGQVTSALGYTPISLGSLSASFPLVYNNLTGAFTIAQASSVQGGFLSSTDWSTFNNKLSTAIIALNGLTSVSQSLQTGSSGTDFAISSSGSVHTFNIPTASGSARGLLSSSDWTSFNSKVSSQWITSGSNIYYNTGNVGIGTTSPGSKLVVVGDGIRYMPVSDASGNSVLVLKDDGSNGTLDICSEIIGDANATSNPITFRVSNVSSGRFEAMRITSGGNVLVGTTNSDIGGTVSGVGIRPGGYVLASNTDTDIFSAPFYSDRRGTNNNGPAYSLAMGGFLKADIGIAGTNSGVDNAAITFNTISFNTTRSERMRITSAGNVGIGTTSPGERLEVAGSNPFIRINDLAATSQSGLSFGFSGNIRGWLLIDYNTGEFRHATGISGNTYFQTFHTNGSERMRITSGGNVGIGQSNPTVRLQVDGGAASVNTNTGAITNNTTLSLRSIDTTATNRVIEGYSISYSALFYVQNNGSYFFAGSNLSDARTKKDINYLNDSVLDKVMQLKPASFKYIQNDENVKGGFIAQDVKEIFPDLVTKTESEEDMMGVDYYGVIGILTKAIQELNAKIERLENGI